MTSTPTPPTQQPTSNDADCEKRNLYVKHIMSDDTYQRYFHVVYQNLLTQSLCVLQKIKRELEPNFNYKTKQLVVKQIINHVRDDLKKQGFKYLPNDIRQITKHIQTTLSGHNFDDNNSNPPTAHKAINWNKIHKEFFGSVPRNIGKSTKLVDLLPKSTVKMLLNNSNLPSYLQTPKSKSQSRVFGSQSKGRSKGRRSN